MKLLIDAQLPKSIETCFKNCDVIHTSSLENGNKTKDKVINKVSIDEKRALITKDVDFYHSFMASNKPYKLVFVKTGNMRLGEIITYFNLNAQKIIELLQNHSFLILEKNRIRILR